MLNIITGRSGTGKTEIIHHRIYAKAGNGEKNLVLIVPEQTSFQREKLMLDHLGAKEAANVQVLSFKRLFEIILEQYGGQTRKRIDDGVKAVLMSLAIEQVSDKLILYQNRSKRRDLAELMLGTVDEYKACAISPEDVMSLSLKIKNQKLSQKLNESAMIYFAYNAILGNTYADPSDDLTVLYEMLLKYQYFKDKEVYIDGFSGFSGQEKNILKVILSQAANTTVSIGCDKDSLFDMNSIFRETSGTYHWFIRMAEEIGTEIKILNLENQKRFQDEALIAIEESVFCFDNDSYLIESDSVKFYEAEDEYDEIRQVCRDISRLVFEENYEFNDIVVICRNINQYSSMIRSEFLKSNISYFLSAPEALETKPLVKLILSAFDIIHSSYSTESVLSFVKTGMTLLSTDDVYLLENYVYIWDIKGKKWKSEFNMNPNGNSSERDEELLSQIEDIRKKIIEPLEKFEKSVKGSSDGAEITKALYELMMDVKANEKVKELAWNFEKSGDIHSKEEEAGIWDTVMNILDKIYHIFENKYVDSRRYDELLRLMLSKNTISDIPETLDSVTIGLAGNIRSENPKAVFVIGAVETEFPAVQEAAGLFSDSERAELVLQNLPLYDPIEGMVQKEKYNIYLALSMAKEKLFISWHKLSAGGEQCLPSLIYREVVNILPKIPLRKFEHLSDEEMFYTSESAFEYCSEIWNENTRRSDTLKQYFENHENYSERIRAIQKAAENVPYRIDGTTARKLFGQKLKMSASRLEKYNLCPFSYFCEYGLKIFPRKKAKMSSDIYGSASHYILEHMLKDDSFKSILTESDENIKSKISDYLQKFMTDICGDQGHEERFKASFKMIINNLTKVIKMLAEEFAQSQFEAVDFELNIGGEMPDIPAYSLKTPANEEVIITGKIDRVDTYIKENKKYIRIIDYKTGEKKFLLSDVLYGLNMQMLLYLSAIEKNGSKKYSENQKYQLLPAGILYMPATPKHIVSEGMNTEKSRNEALKEQKKSMKMNGILIEDRDILEAMEKNLGGIFIPAKKKKDETLSASCTLVSAEKFGKIFEYIDRKIIETAKEIFGGNIEARPAKYKLDACQYCQYQSACGFETGKAVRKIQKISEKDALQEMINGEETKT